MTNYQMKNYESKLVSFAQNSEDIKLFGYFYNFDAPGYYVDIGANHPVHDSVTRFFYLRGWSGVNVEPQEHLLQLLKKDRPKDINIGIGLAEKQGEAVFRQYYSDGLSTFSKDLHKSYEKGHEPEAVEYKEVTLPLQTLAFIFKKIPKNKAVNFLKVDVEGYEYNVLKGNDWVKYRPWVICVEATGADKRWKAILEKNNYTLHMYDGLNEYYIANEHLSLLDKYLAIVSSAVLRYDVAELPDMKFMRNLRSIKRLIIK